MIVKMVLLDTHTHTKNQFFNQKASTIARLGSVRLNQLAPKSVVTLFYKYINVQCGNFRETLKPQHMVAVPTSRFTAN